MLNNFDTVGRMLQNYEKREHIVKNLVSIIESGMPFNGKCHPLGFYSFSLARISDDTNLRLHIWTKDSPIQSQDLLIHNHIFDFTSLVLVGDITNKRYHIEKSTSKKGFMYDVAYTNSGSTLSKCGQGYDITNTTIEEVKKGEYYGAKSEEFHESLNINSNFSATILLTKQTKDANPQVFSNVDYGEKIDFQRIDVPKHETSEILRQLISMI